MVRNSRTVMMCGLLAAAVGLALGSRVTVSGSGDAAVPSLLPWMLGQLEDRAPAASRYVAPPAPVASPVSPWIRAADAGPVGLEGHRRPRGPRIARDDTPRVAR